VLAAAESESWGIPIGFAPRRIPALNRCVEAIDVALHKKL